MKLGFHVSLEFVITQHIRDFFNCGYLIKDGPTKYQYRIRNINDLEQHLFPLLDNYPLQTQKALEAKAFRQIHSLILAKKHLTVEGLDQIRSIKATMIKARMQ
jgi:hypothetical protein